MRLLLIFTMAFLLISGASADTVRKVQITEWIVPWEDSRPRDPYVAPSGKIWFAGQGDGYIASFDPVTENFRKVELGEGAGPHNLIVGKNGTVWIAGNLNAYIGKYTPATDTLHKIPMPSDEAFDPHTLIFNADESKIYFTMQGSNMVGLLDIASEKVELIKMHCEDARPYGIFMAPDGNLWVALFGTNKLAKIDLEKRILSEIILPRKEARPRRLIVTSDGLISYVDYRGGYLGTYDPDADTFEEWPLPSGANSRPYGMVVDSQDRIWLVETGPDKNNFVGFDHKTKIFFSVTPIPSGGGSVRHMMYHKPSGMIWFGTDNNTLGRAQVE